MKPLVLLDPLFSVRHYLLCCPLDGMPARLLAAARKPDTPALRTLVEDRDLCGATGQMGFATLVSTAGTPWWLGVIWVNSRPNLRVMDCLGTLIHEAGHMAELVLDTRQAGGPSAHNEVERLYQDWLVREARAAWRWR